MFVPENRLSLLIEPGSDPIRGHFVRVGDEEPVEFTGWVELASAIEAVRSGGGKSLGWGPGAEPGDGLYRDDRT